MEPTHMDIALKYISNGIWKFENDLLDHMLQLVKVEEP